MREAERRYNALPYMSKPYAETHPDRLATVSRLLGHPAADPRTARVLEIGCGLGGNLVPMGLSLPDATFLGFDLAPKQIDLGNELVEAVGVKNVRLEVADIMDISADYGEFDYIVAHGLYSWVPEAVRDEMVRLIKRHLAPEGVAFVSYNVWPGWGFRSAIRDLMLHATKDIADPEQAVPRAREAMALAHRLAKDRSPWKMVLDQHLQLLEPLPDAYIFHDFMADVNRPVWFNEFCRHISGEGLQFLSEATFADMMVDDVHPEAAKMLEQLGTDLVRREQYKDFLRNRGFRESLLVHDDATPDRRLSWERLVDLRASAWVAPVGEADLTPGVEMEFRTRDERVFGTEKALLKAALLELHAARPNNVAVRDLVARARAAVGGAEEDGDIEIIARNLLFLYTHRLCDLQIRAYRCCPTVTERPRTWSLTRVSAQQDAWYIPNMRHESIIMTNRYEKTLLKLLDGSRDRSDLVDALLDAHKDGQLAVKDADDNKITDPDVVRKAMEGALEGGLESLRRLGFLEA